MGFSSCVLAAEQISCQKCNRYDCLPVSEGPSYKDRVCCFGETVHGLDALQAKCESQWRRGAWLGQGNMDDDLVLVCAGE